VDPTTQYYQDGVYSFEGNRFLALAAIAVGGCNDEVFSLHAYTAHIMAAVAAEAFIDEFAFHLTMLRISGKAPELVRIGTILEQLETSRVQVTEKFNIASQLLPGDPFELGRQPFQSFVQLIKLRNYLAHPKVVSMPPKWFSFFVSNNLTVQKPDAEFVLTEWTSQLQSKQCASWACRATSRIVLDLIERSRELCEKNEVPGLYQGLKKSWDWSLTDSRIWSGQASDRI
jgi:hypothetical protein